MVSFSSVSWTITSIPSITRGWMYRVLSPLLFRKIGAGTRFYGKCRLVRPFSNICIGRSGIISEGVFWQVAGGGIISLGNNCSINRNSLLVCSESITIGNNVAIAELVSIRDSEHNFDVSHGVEGQGSSTSPIRIEDNVWIGRGVYIGPGTHIRTGSIVGANSVVRGDFPPNVLIAGSPGVVRKLLA